MKPHEISEILSSISYKDWRIKLGWPDAESAVSGKGLFLQVRFVSACADTGKMLEQSGRKWVLSPHMTRSEIVTTAFKAVLTAEEHEARECFKYKGQSVFGPHIDVEAMAELLRNSGAEVLDTREEPVKTAVATDIRTVLENR